MTYQDTLSWMFSKLPMYQRQGKSAFKANLDNSISFANHLNNPQNQIKTIHVGGTNGKGSTSNMLSSILQEAGYKVGLSTSPHLKDFRERIRINGQMISKGSVVEFIESNKEYLEETGLSFFEMTSGMAFDCFLKEKVDVAIIEVGLGGRLDSTNIITPELSIITNIGLDHTQFLGDSLDKIAFEKAGIIKKNIPVVIGKTQSETQSVFKNVASSLEASISFADQMEHPDYESDLKGVYQKENIQTVLQAIDVLRTLNFKLKDIHIKEGLKNVEINTGFQGRWQILHDKPLVVCDTAHNSEGLKLVMEQLLNLPYNKLHIVFGVVNDKALETILPLLPKKAIYYFCKPDVPRGLDENILKSIFLENGFKGLGYVSVNEALKAAKRASKMDDIIYIGGSTFVVAEII
ncbi:bifunctional folylpolyglutamate synthase/dihydrofolate synthase [Bizionia argentinensis JUB59]|uniref:Dihydrofolate synthase/folylpolyglutamate synthase n=1 Tax=Bizionia argentinensis JUB59 TaxID=1046627 RepID=G2EGI0_9FLAO|nr:folylpolyglutamate synthase/dihydrofolate synthase family protein [Bizionia argentinensis]EGV42457.1 bifunctional folylpolyglutamate synthase/dihydrofolate synthase [Bizionia argentinensis JUB59]